MSNPQPGETPIEGKCAYCGAGLVEKWADYKAIGREDPVRLTEANPWCVNGHPQPLPQPEAGE